jgi:hypothetical protein
MDTTALGPTMAGGPEPIVEEGYELTYHPDVMNPELQALGQAPVYYYMPNRLRLARKDGKEDGDFLFNLIRFSGVQSADTTVGVTEGSREVAGGVLTFSVTGQVPDHILKTSQQKIIEKYSALPNDHFWGIRTRAEPIFRPAIITANITSITNLSPLADGSVPAVAPRSRARNGSRSGPAFEIRALPSPAFTKLPLTVPASRDASGDSSLTAWYWNVQGTGQGSINVTGTHSYSALVGAYPAAILWEGFHGVYSPINVWMNVKVKFWTPFIKLVIDGHWDRIYEHFEASASGRYAWFGADIKAELNKMRTNGTITVKTMIDPTIQGGDKIQQNLEKRTDLVFNQFMAAAQKMIFEQPTPQPGVAEQASALRSAVSPFGLGLKLNYRRDVTQLNLHYEDEQQFAYLQDDQISGTMEGMFDEMKDDPGAEKKYFLNVYLEDWPRRLARVFKPIASYAGQENNWAGQPVSFLSVQVGYPNTKGEVMWTGKAFQRSDPPDANWSFSLTQKQLADVENPPEGWKPDLTYVKRKVHLLEPPDPQEAPFVRIQIDANEIALDPEPNGSLMNDTTIEVRADSAGKLIVGPISLDVPLENDKQVVEVTFEPTDENFQPIGRDPVRFQWMFADQNESRFWSIYTGDPEFRPFFRYQVRVIVKGSIFTKGMEWTGPWEGASANGPLMVNVPTPEGEGVTTRARSFFAEEAVSFTPVSTAPPPVRAKTTARTAMDRGRPDLEISGYRLTDRSREAPPPVSVSAPPPSHGKPVTEELELEVTPGRAVTERAKQRAAAEGVKAPNYDSDTWGEDMTARPTATVSVSTTRKKTTDRKS